MKFDIDTATSEEKGHLLCAKIIDAVTGQEVKDVAAFDTETGWYRRYADNEASDEGMKVLFRGSTLKLVEAIGNPMRIEFPAAQTGRVK